ncbi:5'-nucleotidase C-terminal domain-containing protein [Nonomuraea sp. NPDC049269]|uniref:5'-nucleotidase C-terminal domain-containing protein n=1 Tax=Nonomuraea sp. NPDC049269 TaxID=3364349 RepID=UPI003716C60E
MADDAQNAVGKLTLAFERTTASKCPVTIKVHGFFEGLPEGAQTIRYRLVGTEEWKTVEVPAGHGGVYTTVLETLDWEYDWESAKTSIQIEIDQPDPLTSNVIYYFKCGNPVGDPTFGVAEEDISRTAMGGPLAELIADAQLESVKSLSGAQAALVSRRAIRWDLPAGPIDFGEVWNVQPAGLAINVYAMTGAQLKTLLGHASPTAGVLTPSASIRYTLTGGVVTELTLNGAQVADDQVLRIAANYNLAAGQEGFPAWNWSTNVYTAGPDDTGALATYLVAHSPIHAPQGDRVTLN